jgi:hypothetical protein
MCGLAEAESQVTFSINIVLCPQITKTIGSAKSKFAEGLHVSPQNLRSAELICGSRKEN